MINESLELASRIIKVLDSKKGEDITALDVADITPMTDCFVFCTGNSNTHVNSLADAVDEALSKDGVNPHHIEGARSGTWILMDYGSVIVHVMYKDTREYYNIERLWRDAQVIDTAEILDTEGNAGK